MRSFEAWKTRLAAAAVADPGLAPYAALVAPLSDAELHQARLIAPVTEAALASAGIGIADVADLLAGSLPI